MTTYTPQQAREMTARALDHGTMAGVVESLAGQVEALQAQAARDAVAIEWATEQLEFIVAERDALKGVALWTLYNHQGGSSPIGQPIRKLLGIGVYDRMTPDQINAARAAS